MNEVHIDHMLHIVTDMVTRAMDVAHFFHHNSQKNLGTHVVVAFWVVAILLIVIIAIILIVIIAI